MRHFLIAVVIALIVSTGVYVSLGGNASDQPSFDQPQSASTEPQANGGPAGAGAQTPAGTSAQASAPAPSPTPSPQYVIQWPEDPVVHLNSAADLTAFVRPRDRSKDPKRDPGPIPVPPGVPTFFRAPTRLEAHSETPVTSPRRDVYGRQSTTSGLR